MATKSRMIDDRRQCFICGAHYPLEKHHLLHGFARRKVADRYGLVVYLCHQCHRNLHDKGTYDRALQEYAQRYFEANYGSREDFRREFGKSYL